MHKNAKSQSDENGRTEGPSATIGAKFFEGIKLDFNTIKIILLTAFAVLCLLSIPAVYILRNFVTFDALDHYLKVTDRVSPKILHAISEEIEAGYSKNIVLDSPLSHDNTLIFHAAKNQKITLTMDVTARSGKYQPLGVQVDGCDIGLARSDSLHLYDRDLTSTIGKCDQSEEPSIHYLRVYTKDPLKPGTALDISCLVLVFERVHDHIEENR